MAFQYRQDQGLWKRKTKQKATTTTTALSLQEQQQQQQKQKQQRPFASEKNTRRGTTQLGLTASNPTKEDDNDNTQNASRNNGTDTFNLTTTSRPIASVPSDRTPPTTTRMKDETLSSSSSSSLLPSSKTNRKSLSSSRIITAIGQSTSIVVSALFYIALVWQRNAFMVSFFVGAIANAVLGKVLKKVINQTRPPDYELASSSSAIAPSDGGMPSSHATSLAFIGTFTLLHLPTTVSIFSTTTSIPLLAIVSPILVLYSMASVTYRVQVKLHTWEQIGVGLILGFANAVLFATFVEPTLLQWLSQQTLLFPNTAAGKAEPLLSYPWLLLPTVVGALVVGSVERRITHWLAMRQQGRREEDP